MLRVDWMTDGTMCEGGGREGGEGGREGDKRYIHVREGEGGGRETGNKKHDCTCTISVMSTTYTITNYTDTQIIF